jgi:hypothetical protein
MKNNQYLLHKMGMLINEMDKPKCDLIRLSTQLEGCLSTMRSGEIDLNVAIRTKRKVANQIFDTDSFVPTAFKKAKRPTEQERIIAAARTLNKAKKPINRKK